MEAIKGGRSRTVDDGVGRWMLADNAASPATAASPGGGESRLRVSSEACRRLRPFLAEDRGKQSGVSGFVPNVSQECELAVGT